MRWTLIILFFLAAASAKYAKKNRFSGLFKNIADLEDELENGLQDWTDDDLDDSEDDETWQEPQRNRYQLQSRRHHQKRQSQCVDPKRQGKWIQDDDDDFESEEEYTPRNRKQHRRQEQEEDYSPRRQKKHRQESEEDNEEPQQQCQPNFQQLEKLDQVNAQLAAKLHQGAKQISDDKNTVVSPVAVQLALAAVARGARGNTKNQINQLLGYGLAKNENPNAHAALTKSLKGEGPNHSGSKSLHIKSTTNIVMNQQSAQEQFIDSIKKCFEAEVKKCDFRRQHQQCRDQINQWVATKTSQKLNQPLAQSDLTTNTKMISIGTMQLKANWGKNFRKHQKTTQGQFYPLGEQKPVQVKVLQTEGDFNYVEDEQMQVLGVQTQEKQLTIYIVLPKDRNGLHHLENQRLQYGKQLQQLLEAVDGRKQTLKVQLPVFQIVHKLDTKQILRRLGIQDAFDGDEADFSGIREDIHEEVLKYGRQTGGLEDVDIKKAAQQHKQQQLHVNKLIQLATIQIDENGIDAASHTKQSKPDIKDDSEEQEHQGDGQFQADHAFAFIVKHNPSNQVLLIGRVVDASQQAENEKGEFTTEE